MTEGLTQAVVDECVGNAHGNLARVRELVDLHPEVVTANATWKETPIEAATQMGNLPIIDFLLERGAPVDFFTACVLGRDDQVKAELAERPGLATSRGVHELPSLYFAAIGGHPQLAELLLAGGAGVNDRCEAAAPIHGAVMGRSPEMVRWLLERGADPEATDYEGRSALMLARKMDEEDLAQIFQ
jgi:ankyrin repeat protein